MVTGAILPQPVNNLLVAQQVAEPLIERLDPPRRAAVVMAIVALVLVALLLVACVMIGAHWVRRLARHQHGPTRATNVENRRLREALRPILPEGPPGETTIAKRKCDETVADR